MNAEVLTLVPNAAVLTPLARTVSGLSICIPVYNEEGAVAETLRRCLAIRDALDRCGVPDLEIIAVDDGSRDGTAAIIARHPEVRLIRHETNRGYGAALKTGFAAARHDLIGFLDADATYPPEHFPQLCMAALGAGGELVIGTRMVGPDTDMPTMRRVGNSFFARLLTLIGRTPVTTPPAACACSIATSSTCSRRCPTGST
jgi:glycosyltransferase involved in cell wall biosynthesis